jgi:hypothetical protein
MRDGEISAGLLRSDCVSGDGNTRDEVSYSADEYLAMAIRYLDLHEIPSRSRYAISSKCSTLILDHPQSSASHKLLTLASKPQRSHTSIHHNHAYPSHLLTSPPQNGTGKFLSRYPNHLGLLLPTPIAAPSFIIKSSIALAHLTNSASPHIVCMIANPYGIP